MFEGKSYPARKKDRLYEGGCGSLPEVSPESDWEQIKRKLSDKNEKARVSEKSPEVRAPIL